MAIKTFTTGEVLTASDTNTFLANAGLVYVTSTTIGSGVSSVTVSNCFSSTMDNYKIVVSGGVASGDVALSLALGASTTGYYGVLNYGAYNQNTPQSAGTSNTASWTYAGVGTANSLNMNVELFNPFAAKTTGIMCFYAQHSIATNGGVFTGFHNVATSYTGFTIGGGGGTMTGGTITVYGYRKA